MKTVDIRYVSLLLTLVLEIPEQVRVRIQAVSHYAGKLSSEPDIELTFNKDINKDNC